MTDLCCDCARPAKYDFHRLNGQVESRCGAHAFPLLAHGRPLWCTEVTVRRRRAKSDGTTA